MSYTERKDLISELEKIRESRILCYILSDRETFPPGIPGFSTQLGSEPQLFFVDQLKKIGRTKKLDLFLYTRGGALDSVWPFICLLREYCEKLSVIIPFRAHSGGTLISLGADEIIMTEFAELSPIDPTTGNQFNPVDPTNPKNRLGISVEDVAAFFKLSKELAGIKQDTHKLEVFKELTGNGPNSIHPLALGNVQRVYMQIRQLANRLLALHIDKKSKAKKIDEIIAALTEEFYSHLHAISRKEAIRLMGDWVKFPAEAEEEIILELFNSYAETLGFRSRFNLPQFMEDVPLKDLSVAGAFIESTAMSHIFVTDIKVMQRPNFPANVQVQVPPGQALPLVPWVSRSYDFGIQKMGWFINEKGV